MFVYVIKSYIQKNPYALLRDIQIVLQTTIKKNYSITQIHRLLKRLRITRKRTKRIVRKSKAYIMNLTNQRFHRLEQKRKSFIRHMKNISLQQIISLDESDKSKT